jgi:hypothetical protein
MKAWRSRTGRLAMKSITALLPALCMALFALPAAVRAQSIPEPISQPPRSQGVLRPEANRLPDANDIMVMREEKVTKEKFEAANTERKRQIDSDSVLLLKLTTEVKAELDKDPASASSPDLRKKIDEIERLAHAVQVKMKLTMIAAQ